MKKLKVTQDCFCQHYIHEKTNYPREGLVEKKLKKGDIVNFDEKFTNFYGTYWRVEKEGVEYDIFPENLSEYEPQKIVPHSGTIVDQYIITEHDSGIVQLTFNTKYRWVYCHALNDNEYSFIDDEEEIIKIEKLPLLSNNYIRTFMQNKDQISFYFIPFHLLK